MENIKIYFIFLLDIHFYYAIIYLIVFVFRIFNARYYEI